MKKHKSLIVIILMILTLFVSHALPKPRYSGTGFISQLEMPRSVGEWHGEDVTSALELDFDKDWNKFISEALIYQYHNKEDQPLHFIVLDAGNFHHPNVCFTAAGYEIKEVNDSEFRIAGRSIRAHTLYTTKGIERNLSFYWIIIDKVIVQNWVEQKIKQLYFSLFNRKRTGLMVRIDIPTTDENNIDMAKETAQKFISALSRKISPEKEEYLFGARMLKE